ncbi:MAG TPA: hypothetical protein DDW78_10320 [Treponema sp.]|nr:hypothetical protein [Treponema sp.]
MSAGGIFFCLIAKPCGTQGFSMKTKMRSHRKNTRTACCTLRFANGSPGVFPLPRIFYVGSLAFVA